MAGIAPATFVAESVSFIAEAVGLEGLAESRNLAAQSLTMYAAKITKAQQPPAIALFMTGLLERAAKEGVNTHAETAARLLDLAAVDNASFRAIVTGMDGERKQLLEKILKSRAGVQRATSDNGTDREPTIALKMNFGG